MIDQSLNQLQTVGRLVAQLESRILQYRKVIWPNGYEESHSKQRAE